MNIQETLKKLHANGYKDGHISKIMGVDRSTVAHLRAGRTKTINWQAGDKLFRFAKATRCIVIDQKIQEKR